MPQFRAELTDHEKNSWSKPVGYPDIPVLWILAVVTLIFIVAYYKQ